jgi:hypothetical protein
MGWVGHPGLIWEENYNLGFDLMQLTFEAELAIKCSAYTILFVRLLLQFSIKAAHLDPAVRNPYLKRLIHLGRTKFALLFFLGPRMFIYHFLGNYH